MASTYRWSYKKNKDEFYTKDNFEVKPYCQSKYENADRNMLNRLRSSLIQGINDQSKLPKFIIVILDDDIIEYIGYTGQGSSALMGKCIEWISNEFENLVEMTKKSLPPKAVKEGYPQFYWVAPPHHKNFHDNGARTKLTNVLEISCKSAKNMRLIRMKEIWQYTNDELINSKGQFTDEGWDTYWKSVDAAIKFNVNKRELYLANQLRNSSKVEHKGTKRPGGNDSAMNGFFKRNKTGRPKNQATRKLPNLNN